MFIVNHRRIFYLISAIIIGASMFAFFTYGLRLGLDFTGGSLLSVEFSGVTHTVDDVRGVMTVAGYNDASVRTSGANGYIVRLPEISGEEKNILMQSLAKIDSTVVEKEFSTIGPVLGDEAVRKSWLSISLVLLAIVLFIAFAFRKVSKPLSSWTYGLVTIIALAHDVIIPAGVFSLLGHWYGFEVDTLFVTALLVILGFSVHDTIVVFDRVRENLQNDSGKKPFEQIVGESINQTFVRSINTSLTTLLAILILYIYGPEATHHFALTLLIGITAGVYSSIFIGSPLLVTINKLRGKR